MDACLVSCMLRSGVTKPRSLSSVSSSPMLSKVRGNSVWS